MSGHDFEKQVRHKLDDLKMKPSAKAWENIEQNLRDRRRRFAPVLWLPLMLLGLSAGGYLLFRKSEPASFTQQKLTQQELSQKELTEKDPNQKEFSQKESTEKDPKQKELSQKELTEKQPNQKQPTQQRLSQQELSQKELTEKDPNQLSQKELTEKDLNQLSKKELTEKDLNQKELSQKELAQRKLSKQGIAGDVDATSGKKFQRTQDASLRPSDKKMQSAAIDSKDGNFRTISSQNITRNNFTSLIPENNISNIPNKKIASRELPSLNSKVTAKPTLPKYAEAQVRKPALQKKQNKWWYGLSGTAGISTVSEGNFFDLNINKSQVEDVAMMAAFAPQPYRPSSISSGFTYSLGAFVKRDLSKRFSLSAGLNYLQLNTRNKVGSRINARQVVNNGNRGYIFVSSYYTLQQDQTSEYRNRYHFLELPVELHTRLNRSEKMPLFLNTGLAVSQLITSNSLHFDGSTGVYYKNDKLLNQTQLAAKAGFSVGLLNKTTRPIWVGPFARYNVSKILQKDVSASKSFASFGVDAKLFIK